MLTSLYRFLFIIFLSCCVFCSILWPNQISAEQSSAKQSAGIQVIRQFGDSITYGYGFVQCAGIPGFCMTYWKYNSQLYQCASCAIYSWGGGYRGWMTELALQPSNQFLFATEGYQCGGSYTAQWETNSMSHDGYPGFRTDQLVPLALLPSNASITLVHAGTNDFVQGKSVSSAETNLTQIVQNLISQNANTKIYVAQIVRFVKPASTCTGCADHSVLNPLVKQYNEWIQSTLANNFAKQVVVVNMYDALQTQTDYSPDGVHPGPVGYQKMACSWIRAIKQMPSSPSDPCNGFSFGETKKQKIPSEPELQKSMPPSELMNQIMQGKSKNVLGP
ncbi:lipase [Leptospira langatensis]|uniref:Lipase n=2 Tax=Leptospira langatensis TaxID=2484983 RepID=A0A5F1ZR64_9LEPT|nr:GDSL-type esterase/lipase family protein [Leptospira langatensis]TGK02613.1 lipase [Leptospira langatensis]TGL40185.1 lipase [Leptospira langatensis]